MCDARTFRTLRDCRGSGLARRPESTVFMAEAGLGIIRECGRDFLTFVSLYDVYKLFLCTGNLVLFNLRF